MRYCEVPGCMKPHLARGLCSGHRAQQERGVPLTTLHPRGMGKREVVAWWLSENCEVTGECIVPLSNQKRAYPQVRIQGKTYSLHRLSYEVHHGPTRGMEVHHTCANNRCVNPDHLQLVSQLNNIAEMRERQSYLSRIAELEDALYELSPCHSLLEGIDVYTDSESLP